jgi:hypothetical protein
LIPTYSYNNKDKFGNYYSKREIIKEQIPYYACNNMGLFWQNNETTEEDNGELENMSAKLKRNLGELECEEAIIEDKERFGRARKSMMNVLRAKYTDEIANRALSRINKRLQEGYLNS